MNKSLFLVNLMLMLMLAACTAIPSKRPPSIATGFPESPWRPAKKAPPAVAEVLVPDFNDALDSKGFAGYQVPMNISVHEVSARDFFMGLVVDTKENMVVHPEVSGTITLELKNVTVEQILDAVQKVYGYDYKKSEIGYIIYPATLQTKLFKVNRLDLIRLGKSKTRVSSGQRANQGDNANNSNNQSNNNTPNNNDQSDADEPGSWLTTSTDTDFWKELDDTLHAILAVDKQASSVINRQSGVVVVRAKPTQIREVEAFLATTQTQISRQVILEAKILEVILDDGHQAGVNWESIVREGMNKAPLLTGVGALAITSASKEVFSLGGKAGDFRAFVELLETQGKTNILSSPRISTLNNQKAIIKVGRDEYFITKLSTTTVPSNGFGSGITNPNATLTPFFSGIALDVTPQIDDEENVTLHIHPSITRVEQLTKTFTLGSGTAEVPTALNTVRESDSIVKAQNGQVIVLGGLMQESDEESKEGVAGLTQIPLLGNLFRVNKGKIKKSELIILLKTTIINSDSDWQNAINNNKQHYKRLDAIPRWQ
ncbi:MAG: pilus (MSHA type) biogenesis protein MshL [Methylococcaceae bacterium]|nr:pilus (MSHA type) biogenesis protein MshL [Methylococcaceae bacterium]